MRCCFDEKEKAPVPDGLAALGTRAETTGQKPFRSSIDNTATGDHASNARIGGTLRLRFGGGQ